MTATGSFITHLAATLFMTGVIWFVQIVHYPLLGQVGAAEFESYEQRHVRYATALVGPVMILEALATLLLVWIRPAAVPAGPVIVCVALLAIAWASTFLVQVRCHAQLARAHNPRALRRLVRSNWLRVGAWTGKSIAALWMVTML